MTAVRSIYTGGRILASAARNAWPQAVIKGIDQSSATAVGSFPTTLDNDQELYLPVSASTSYLFCCYLDYEGDDDTRPNGGIDYAWIVPSGATMRFQSIGRTFGGGTTVKTTQTDTTKYQLGSTGSGNLMAALIFGTLVTGTAAGTLQFTWTTYEMTMFRPETIVHAQSFLALWQVSP